MFWQNKSWFCFCFYMVHYCTSVFITWMESEFHWEGGGGVLGRGVGVEEGGGCFCNVFNTLCYQRKHSFFHNWNLYVDSLIKSKIFRLYHFTPKSLKSYNWITFKNCAEHLISLNTKGIGALPLMCYFAHGMKEKTQAVKYKTSVFYIFN